MCGIAGLIRTHGLAPGDVPAVVRMTEAQAHRGPDGCDYYRDARAVLAHRRLSIIDVSAAGAQPMSNEDGSISVTYNGEIYNHQELREELLSLGHQFRSHADTEVIVHGYEAWGVDGLLERLRGMFAFGVYEQYRGLTLARDRIGIKPLYYYEDSDAGVLMFASEVKALLRSGIVPDERDPLAIAGFLLGGSVPAPRTIVKAISSLRPGHFLAWRDGQSSIRKYWDLPVDGCSATLLGSRKNGRRAALLGTRKRDVENLRVLLEDSVSRHLVSDVPLGVFLSGGVDSGAVVAFAAAVMNGDSSSPNSDVGRVLLDPPLKHLTVLTIPYDD